MYYYSKQGKHVIIVLFSKMHSYSIRAIFELTIDPFSTSRNTFIARNSDNQHSFALISEVVDSKPPRLNKLRPALILTLAMLIIVAIGPALFPEQNMQSLLGTCSYGLIELLWRFMHRLLTLFLPLFVFKLASIVSLWSCGIIHICVYGNIITTRVPRRRELGSVRYHRLCVWDWDCNGKFGETGSGSFQLLKLFYIIGSNLLHFCS